LPALIKFDPDGAYSVASRLKNVNRDARLDSVLKFHTQQTGLRAGALQACLIGEFRDGSSIEECDNIHSVPYAHPFGRVETIIRRNGWQNPPGFHFRSILKGKAA
jgi:hypothetical protein